MIEQKLCTISLNRAWSTPLPVDSVPLRLSIWASPSESDASRTQPVDATCRSGYLTVLSWYLRSYFLKTSMNQFFWITWELESVFPFLYFNIFQLKFVLILHNACHVFFFSVLWDSLPILQPLLFLGTLSSVMYLCRKEMASWLADLTKSSRSADRSSVARLRSTCSWDCLIHGNPWAKHQRELTK